MMADFYVKATTEFSEVEPDGSNCEYCKESIYLKQWACQVLVTGSVVGTIPLCDSCKSMIDEQDTDG